MDAPTDGPMSARNGLRTLHGDPDTRVRNQTGHSIVDLARLQRRYIHRTGLAGCQLVLDTGCNARCIHCFLGSKRPIPDLHGVTQLLDHDLPAAGLQTSLYYSEPFLTCTGEDAAGRRRIADLLGLIARHQPGLLLSNGIGIDSQSLAVLRQLGSFRIYLSLLGANAETHDRITRVPGSFRKVRKVLQRLTDPSYEHIAVCINMLVHRASAAQIDDMLRIAAESRAASVYLMALHPGPRPSAEVDELAFTAQEQDAFLGEIARVRARFVDDLWIELGPSWGPNFHTRGIHRHLYRGHPYCPAGRTQFALHPTTGILYPCMNLSGREEYAIGYWDADEKRPIIDPERNVLGRISEDPTLLKGRCAPDRCAYAPICLGGCRAAAAAHADGDLLAELPSCATRWLER